MSMYRSVHTGPNTKLGGVHEGRTIVAYHVPTPSKEKKDPMPPASSERSMKSAYGAYVGIDISL